MLERKKFLELPMRQRIVTEVSVSEDDYTHEQFVELSQSVPIMWTTSEQTMLLTLEEFAKLFMFVFSEPRPTDPGWWLSSAGDMLKVLNGNHCYLNHMSSPVDFACLSFPDDIAWTKICNLKPM